MLLDEGARFRISANFSNPADETEFRKKNEQNLAIDGQETLTYIAPNNANLMLAQERWPDVGFRATREI